MIHDRVSFGGVLIAIGVLYLWLSEFPLRQGQAWSWWTFLASGIIGFMSFLAYLGYGYLDTWHGFATLSLLPVFVVGITRSFTLLQGDKTPSVLWIKVRKIDLKNKVDVGWLCVVLTGVGMMGAGSVIMTLGMTSVFVPEDLIFLQMTHAQIAAINPHLIPLIAHDRAGFGGGLISAGLVVALIALHAKPSRNVFQAMAIAGSLGFVCAIIVHLCIGYLVITHIAPACTGAILFAIGMSLIAKDCLHTESSGE